MSCKNIQPLGNRVLVKRSAPKTMKGGIILPDNAKEKPKQGEVVAVGPGKMDKKGDIEAMELKVGDQVLFAAYAGSEIKSEKEDEYLIIPEDDILGVLVN